MSEVISDKTATQLMAFHVWIAAITQEYGRTVHKDLIASEAFNVGNLVFNVEVNGK